MFFYRSLASCLLAVCVISCVTAPNDIDTRFLDGREVNLVSHIVRGKQYSKSGRASLAEREFRMALEVNPTLDSVYNDLGYTLMSQNRYSEAREMFDNALELNPRNVIALENKAKLLYRSEQYSAAVREYGLLLDSLYLIPKSEIREVIGEEFSESELVEIYRSISSAYLALGYFDEAICYSRLARDRQPDFYQTGIHSRLLMTLGETHAAKQLLSSFLVFHQGKLPPNMLIDLGISLLVTNEASRAREAFSRGLAGAQLSRSERRAAWLGSIIAAKEEGKDDDVELLSEQLLKSQEALCEDDQFVEESYWPIAFADRAAQARTTVCAS